MAISLVQSNGGARGPGNSTVVFGANTVTGNAVIVGITHGSGTNGSYTVSDATNGTYNNTVISSDLAMIRDKRNITGGFTTVSITAPGADSNYTVWCFEIAGADNVLSIQTGSIFEGAAVTSHVSSSVGLSATGFALAAASFGDAGGTITPGTNWTRVTGGTNAGIIIQYRIALFSSDTGQYTTSASVITAGALAIVPELAATGANFRPRPSRPNAFRSRR